MKTVERLQNIKGPLVSLDMKGLKWNELFNSEEELINSLYMIKDLDKLRNKYKGYQYIISFKNYLLKGWELSPKQIVQLKRNAGEVYRYLRNTEKYGNRH